jgi:hypothetical protein
MRRLVLAGIALGAVAGIAAPSFASGPVTVHRGPNGTSVDVSVVQPLVGASVGNDGNVCVGISFEIPVCTGT